jgi:hypothetical protein
VSLEPVVTLFSWFFVRIGHACERPQNFYRIHRAAGVAVTAPSIGILPGVDDLEVAIARPGGGLEPFHRPPDGIHMPRLREHDEHATRTAAEPRAERRAESRQLALEAHQ